MSSATHVFNQYYFDFLKKLKNLAKEKKDDDVNARVLRKAIKKHYSSYDRLSDEYRTQFQTFFLDWKEYLANDEWIRSEHASSALVYQGVTVENILKLTSDPMTTHYFVLMFVLFSRQLDEESVSNIIKYIREKDATVFVHDDEMVLSLVTNAKNFLTARDERIKKDTVNDDTFKAMENTSLGKLAKEILDEVNVSELQDSIGDGDILKSLANPNSGITKLLGTVSQKMLSKMANGELKHESLLEDAMKLATNIPGMGDLGAIGNIMKNFTGGGAGGDFDMGGIADLMKNFGLGQKTGGGGGGAKTRINTTAVNQHMRRNIQAKQMRKKLEKRQQGKENVHGDVEDKQ